MEISDLLDQLTSMKLTEKKIMAEQPITVDKLSKSQPTGWSRYFPMHLDYDINGQMISSNYHDLNDTGGYLSYEYDELTELLKTLPDEKINKIELAEFDKPNDSTIMEELVKLLGFPKNRSVIIHTDNFVYCVDRSNDAMHITSRTPEQWKDFLDAGVNREYYEGNFKSLKTSTNTTFTIHSSLSHLYEKHEWIFTSCYCLICTNCIQIANKIYKILTTQAESAEDQSLA